MRTGNGRHRRPRQAPALFVTAGVTGAGLALPLLGAGAAHAADATTWDRVAQCESGGIWSSAPGNGFYGGLQLTLDMWRDHGGLEYAARPDLASRSQQIAVAQAILAERGPDAWPRCAVDAGLTEDGGTPDVDPGGTPPADTDGRLPDTGTGTDPGTDTGTDPGTDSGQDGTRAPGTPDPDTTDPSTPDPSTTPGMPDPTGSPKAPGEPQWPDGTAPSGDPSTDPSGHAADPAGPSHPSRTAPPADRDGSRGDGSGRHRGGGDDEGDGDRTPGRHASRGGERAEPGDGSYTVRPGDNLSAIAEARELPGGWPALYERNEDVIGDDPDLIHPGQLLDLGR
ncbi:transglycosylase family protein [Streptomyces sp. NPDC002067]